MCKKVYFCIKYSIFARYRRGLDINNPTTKKIQLSKDNYSRNLGSTLNHMTVYLIIGLFGLFTQPLAPQTCDLRTTKTPSDSVTQTDEVLIARHSTNYFIHPIVTQTNNLSDINMASCLVVLTNNCFSFCITLPTKLFTILGYNKCNFILNDKLL